MPRSLTQKLWLFALALGCVCRPGAAAPPAAAPVKEAVQRAAPLPDYGGRESALGSAVDNSGAAPAMNPLAQVGRALEALVIVLALVVGGLYGLKRLGVIKADGQSAPGARWSSRPRPRCPAQASPSDWIALLDSQTLPNAAGAGLHVVSVAGRTLLLGATAQAVTLLAELDSAQDAVAEPDDGAFAAYLQKAGVAAPPAEAGRQAEQTLAGATDRLQSLLARSRKESSPQ